MRKSAMQQSHDLWAVARLIPAFREIHGLHPTCCCGRSDGARPVNAMRLCHGLAGAHSEKFVLETPNMAAASPITAMRGHTGAPRAASVLFFTMTRRRRRPPGLSGSCALRMA